MARFVASAPRHDVLPDLGLPEIAFAGRSNVGKSSLLGSVLGQGKLVRTSRTPGRTQSLNLFELEGKLALVDLPGYGYAKLPKAQREAMNAMVRDYLAQRGPLRGVVLLVDPRLEEVSPLDKQMASFVLDAGRQLLLVVTKTDLIPKTRLKQVVRRIERELGVPQDCAIASSSKTGVGRRELEKALWELAA